MIATAPDPFDEGFHAWADGLPEVANPYKKGSDDYLDWRDGWLAAEKVLVVDDDR